MISTAFKDKHLQHVVRKTWTIFLPSKISFPESCAKRKMIIRWVNFPIKQTTTSKIRVQNDANVIYFYLIIKGIFALFCQLNVAIKSIMLSKGLNIVCAGRPLSQANHPIRFLFSLRLLILLEYHWRQTVYKNNRLFIMTTTKS